MSFGTMPADWVERRLLCELSARPGVLGRSIAALKCYLAIAAHHRANETGVVMSYLEIGEIAKLSKPSIIEGIEIARSMDLLTVDSRASRNTNRYGFPTTTGGFRKIPQDRVFHYLKLLGTRHERYLDALKSYLVFLYLRDGTTSTATVSHSRLVHYTGIRPENVAAANSVLAACHFMHIRTTDDWSQSGHPTNQYRLLGDFLGRLPTRTTAATRKKEPKAAESKTDEQFPFLPPPTLS